MTNGLILAIDQGTTNSKALAVDVEGQVVAEASLPMRVQHPQPGWAEQSATDIWHGVGRVVADVAEQVGDEFDAIAISNQRETIVAWDARTGMPLAPAITWQCRRSTELCGALRSAGYGDVIETKTGLGLDPLFPAAKIAWLIESVSAVGAAAADGTLRVGTVDSWLLWNFTRGSVHATDHSNASRTQLLDTASLRWDDELLRIFNVPAAALPEPRPSDSTFGHVAANVSALAAGTPIQAVMGDSHAALFGHGIRVPGTVKATYGTGSSLMTLTLGRKHSTHGLSSTIAWSTTDGGTAYALEGNISVSGQAAAFMAEILGLDDAAALAELASTVHHSNGVTFVPALVGLGAPHWMPEARGIIAGLALGTKRPHLAYAAIEAIAQQVADVFDAMQKDLGTTLDQLSADGGATRNDALMQLQANIIGRSVRRSERPEASALGAAMMASQAIGRTAWAPGDSTTFAPRLDSAERDAVRARWREALARTLLNAH